MNRKIKSVIVGGVVAGAMAASSIAGATATFDAATGEGFVGKGDVQQALGWNNKQLQENAGSLEFASVSTVVTEVSWTCTNTNNENLQQRERTSTIRIEGVVNAAARDRNQITGFNLTGYRGTPTESAETDGQPLNSCPSGPWTLTTPAGEPVPVEGENESMLTVNGVEL